MYLTPVRHIAQIIVITTVVLSASSVARSDEPAPDLLFSQAGIMVGSGSINTISEDKITVSGGATDNPYVHDYNDYELTGRYSRVGLSPSKGHGTDVAAALSGLYGDDSGVAGHGDASFEFTDPTRVAFVAPRVSVDGYRRAVSGIDAIAGAGVEVGGLITIGDPKFLAVIAGGIEPLRYETTGSLSDAQWTEDVYGRIHAVYGDNLSLEGEASIGGDHAPTSTDGLGEWGIRYSVDYRRDWYMIGFEHRIRSVSSTTTKSIGTFESDRTDNAAYIHVGVALPNWP